MASDKVKIAALEMENVKRVKAISMEPAKDGLTVIGGRNGQGKTSVLDAIAWALGGEKFRPEKAQRDGAASSPRLKVELTNGLVVERSGKTGSLKVTSSDGTKGSQTILNEFVEALALDLPRFIASNDKEKAQTLLKIIGVEDELEKLDRELSHAEQRRLVKGQEARRARGFADSMPFWSDAEGAEPVDVTAVAERQRECVEKNAANVRKRMEAEHLAAEARRLIDAADRAKEAAHAASEAAVEAQRAYEACQREVDALVDLDVSGLDSEIEAAQELNDKIRDNSARKSAIAEADSLDEEYRAIDEEVAEIRRKRTALLEGADMPLDGLGVEDGSLVYNGHAWAGMSSSEQLMVATAVVRKLKPGCGFVLVDKLEQMDVQTLAEFAAWCEAEGLQVIGTRVSTGDECSVIIEDGMVERVAEPQQTDAPVADNAAAQAAQPATPEMEPLAVPPMAFAVADGRAF